MTTSPELLRGAGMEAATNAADMRTVAWIDALIDAANESGVAWSANDLRNQLPTTSQGLVGARIRAASMRRPLEMVAVGEVKSNLNSTHAKTIKVWRGTRAVNSAVAS